jgi:hypothetical protein
MSDPQTPAEGSPPLLWYVAQQIRQFHLSVEELTMQYPDTQEMEKVFADLRRSVIADFTPEELREDLREVYSPQEMLAVFSPQALLDLFRPQDRLQGLSAEDRLRLKQILDRDS